MMPIILSKIQSW